MDENLVARVGTFFILVGFALLIIFVGSILSKDTQGIYLFLSSAAFLVGFLFRRNKPVNESGRFGIIRRAGEYSRQRRAERMNNNQRRSNPSPGRRRQSQSPGRKNEQTNNQNGDDSDE
jgi:hypothetical protein